jgi:hypothetical protein
MKEAPNYRGWYLRVSPKVRDFIGEISDDDFAEIINGVAGDVLDKEAIADADIEALRPAPFLSIGLVSGAKLITGCS